MATTQVADAIQDAIHNPQFMDYVYREALARNRFIQSGVFYESSPITRQLLSPGGRVVAVPYWNPLTGDAGKPTDSPDDKIVPDKVNSGHDQAVRNAFTKAWSSANLTQMLAGSDPLGNFGARLAEWQNSYFTKVAAKTLKGVLASNVANNGGDMLLDLTATGTQSVDRNAMIAAEAQMGERFGQLGAMVVHSNVLAELRKNDGDVQDLKASENGLMTSRYLERYDVIVDNTVTVEMVGGSPVYTTFVLGYASIALGRAPHPKSDLVWLPEEAQGNGWGVDTVINRGQFAIHLAGIRYNDILEGTGAITGQYPTDDQLMDAIRWTRVYEREEIPFVAIKSVI